MGLWSSFALCRMPLPWLYRSLGSPQISVEEIRAPMGMLLDHIRTMLAMPANRQQWEEKQGAFDEAAVEKFTAPLKTRLSAEQPLPSMPRPNPVCRKPRRTQAWGMKAGSTTGLYRQNAMAVVTAEAASAGLCPPTCSCPAPTCPGVGPALSLM